MLSKRDFELSKRAQVFDEAAVRRTAESLFKIVEFLFYRVPAVDRGKFYSRVRGKIIRIDPNEIALKKMPPSAVIGQSVGIAKNILNGLNPAFIQSVLTELVRLLTGAR